jgi:acyl carrier protein
MSEQTQSELIGILAELGLVEPDKVKGDIVFADLDADSLALMDLCVSLEERYDFVIEPADVMKQATVQNLARFIEEKRPKAS